MSPIAGSECVRCAGPIADPLDAAVCPGCGQPVHHACRAAAGARPCPGCEALAAGVDTTTPQPSQAPLAYQVPDLRRRLTRRQKVRRALLLLVLVAGAAGLCFAGYRWWQRNRVERVVRQNFERQMHQGVASVHLPRVGPGAYQGTLTTTTGELWKVSVWAEPHNRFRWQLRPPLERTERQLREDVEQKMQKKVRSVKLTRGEDGRIQGLIETELGEQFDVRESGDETATPHFSYEWNRATVEKWIREHARRLRNDNLRSLSLTRTGPARYSGKAVGTSGIEYDVSIVPAPPEPGGVQKVRALLNPVPASYPLWVKRCLTDDYGLKVKTLKLAPHAGGYHAGQALTESGVVWAVRAGVPPARRNSPDRDVVCAVAMSPASYETWARNTLGRQSKSKIVSLELRAYPDGEHIGTARLENGQRYHVRIEKKKADNAVGPEKDWPDLPPVNVQLRCVPILFFSSPAPPDMRLPGEMLP